MTGDRPGVFWVLAVLGPCQALLAASILSANGLLWVLTAVGYLLWLTRAVPRRAWTAGGYVGLGYLLPLAAFAALYALGSLPAPAVSSPDARPAVRRAVRPAPSDVPVPRLTPPGTDGRLARGLWRTAVTFLYHAGCGLVGLFWHTPLTVYLAAAVVGAFTLGRPEEFP